MQKGLVHIYYGDGKGKTTAGIGLGVRAAGSGLRVHMVQFLKTDKSGELKSLKKLKNFSLGDAPAILPFYFKMSQKEKDEYKKYALSLFNAAVTLAESDDIDLLIMDEVLDAVSLDIIPTDSLLLFMKNKPQKLELVLTGHSVADELLNQADYVSKISAQKHPFEKGVMARKGIEF